MRSLSAPSQMSPRHVQQTIKQKDAKFQTPKTHMQHRYLTNITLPPPSHTHTYTHAQACTLVRTHTHAHIFPRLLKHVQESLHQQEYEIEESWVFSWNFKAKFEHVAQRKGDCSRWKDQWKKRRAVLGIFYVWMYVFMHVCVCVCTQP